MNKLLSVLSVTNQVNERVGAGNWESGEELGDTWASRNAYSYGRCACFPGHNRQPEQ